METSTTSIVKRSGCYLDSAD